MAENENLTFKPKINKKSKQIAKQLKTRVNEENVNDTSKSQISR